MTYRRRYVILLGSNIDKETNLPRSEQLLESRGFFIQDRSGIYESEAVGGQGAPSFHNRALWVETEADLEGLQAGIRAIENECGRQRGQDPNAPRPIDIDIILALDSEGRVAADPVPDRSLRVHHHVAVPVSQIAGHLELPDGSKVSEVLADLGPRPRGFHRRGLAALAPPPGFAAALQDLEVPLEEDRLTVVGRYLSLLLETNERFNLTAIRDDEEAWIRHILDSLTLRRPLEFIEAESVIDIGSGGGLPGIPLAIAMPGAHFTLLETTGKKVRFLESAVLDLELDNVTVAPGRAETLGRDRDHREAYDAVLARALGPLPVLLELTVPFARIGGGILAIKGERAEEEIAAAKKSLYLLHSHVVGTERTPTGTIILVEKMRRTPRRYPRKPGEPKRAPLGA